jgi:hypothetical protein
MVKKIEEAQQEFNSIFDYTVGVALGPEIHEAEQHLPEASSAGMNSP